MSRATLKMTGVQEMRDEIQQLPDNLTDDAQQRIDTKVEVVAAEMRAAYPKRTGELAAGVLVMNVAGNKAHVAEGVIVNTAPYASVFEHGAVGRARGGTMPAGNVFIPRMMRARRDLEPEVAEDMTERGLKVTRRA